MLKLKTSTPNKGLAYQFRVSEATVFRITYIKWLKMTDTRLAALIHWPDRDSHQKTMPAAHCQDSIDLATSNDDAFCLKMHDSDNTLYLDHHAYYYQVSMQMFAMLTNVILRLHFSSLHCT